MTKTDVTTLLKCMPDNFTLDEIIEKLIFVEKLNEGIRDCEEGRTIPHNEVKKIMEGWKNKPNS